MLGAVRYALLILLLAIFFSIVSPQTAKRSGIISVSADLRADRGPAHSLGPKLTNVNRVRVDELARQQHIGGAADSRNKPFHMKFFEFVDEAVAQTSAPGSASSKTPAAESKEPTKIPLPPAAKPKVPSSKSASPANSIPPVDKPEEEQNLKSPSILQMLEGHEKELMIAAAVAAAFFFIGWICGGHYYLRRDRRRRTKIRF
jgi:hypothetical protein